MSRFKILIIDYLCSQDLLSLDSNKDFKPTIIDLNIFKTNQDLKFIFIIKISVVIT